MSSSHCFSDFGPTEQQWAESTCWPTVDADPEWGLTPGAEPQQNPAHPDCYINQPFGQDHWIDPVPQWQQPYKIVWKSNCGRFHLSNNLERLGNSYFYYGLIKDYNYFGKLPISPVTISRVGLWEVPYLHEPHSLLQICILHGNH